MDCPKCGYNVSEIICEKCGFHLMDDEIRILHTCNNDFINRYNAYISDVTYKELKDKNKKEELSQELTFTDSISIKTTNTHIEDKKKSTDIFEAKLVDDKILGIIKKGVSNTRECIQELEEIKTAYSSLTQDQQDLVKLYPELKNAYEKYYYLVREKRLEADDYTYNRKIAADFDDKIKKIKKEGIVYTEECYKKLREIEDQYIHFNKEQKEFVKNYNTFLLLKAKYNDLKREKKISSDLKTLVSIPGIVICIVIGIGLGLFLIYVVMEKQNSEDLSEINNDITITQIPENLPETNNIATTMQVNDTIVLGRYEQDDDFYNGPEEITWIVKEINDNEAILIADRALDVVEYNYTNENVSWKESTLREWLNGYFISAAFSENEQKLLLQKQNISKTYNWDGEKLTPLVDESVITADKVFIESYEDQIISSNTSDYTLPIKEISNRSDLTKWVRDYVVEEPDNGLHMKQKMDDRSKFVIASPSKKAFIYPEICIDLKTYEEFDNHNELEESVMKSYTTTVFNEFNNGLKNGLFKQVLFSKDYNCVYCLNNDGTITVFNSFNWRKENTLDIEGYEGWENVRSISLLDEKNIGAITDEGKVLVINKKIQKAVSEWEGIDQVISLQSGDLVGLTKDGEIRYPTKKKIEEEHEINSLKNCEKLFYLDEPDIIFGLSSDGSITCPFKLYTVDKDGDFKQVIKDWDDLKDIAITSGPNDIVGLTNEGKLVYGGTFKEYDELETLNEEILSSWSDISSISAGYAHIVALRNDGTVYALGNNYFGQCNVQNWKDIIRIEAFDDTTIGYKSDGSIVYAGYNPIDSFYTNPFVYKYTMEIKEYPDVLGYSGLVGFKTKEKDV